MQIRSRERSAYALLDGQPCWQMMRVAPVMSTSISPLLAPMFSSGTMRAVCDDLAYLQAMLDFEAALARAEAAVGVVPEGAATPIGQACKAGAFDLAGLAEAATR